MLDPKSPEYWLNQSLINGEKALQQTIATGNAQDLAQSAQKKAQEIGENLNLAHHHIFQLKNEVEYYKKLLAKPMAEIAEENHDFKNAYETQMELLADWMVSQKAFKELAIQFGIEKGLTPTEVHQMGLNKKLDVLENKNDPSHKTNSSDLTTMQEEVDRLKLKAKLK